MNLSILLLILLIILIIGLLGLFLYFSKYLSQIREHQLSNQQDRILEMVDRNISTNIANMQQMFQETTSSLNLRLDKAAHVIGQVNRELGSMSEIGRNLKDFQAFLTAPKLRGNLGEQILYDAMSQVFSSHQYTTQFKFKDGQIVDAVIKTNDALIPIDSKFPMESFRFMCQAQTQEDQDRCKREFIKTVKKHISDVGKKYILPQEKTVDFAVMYIPSENVYYEIIVNNEEILDFAKQSNVLLVSPNSFFHFLRVILMGLERTKIQEEAQKIWELLKSLQQESLKVNESLTLVNRHLTNAKNAMDITCAEYLKFSSKIEQVKLLK
jgi:DNA recombination protein RmuC